MSNKNPISEINAKVRNFLQKELPVIAGNEAVNEFRENFVRQGFRNNGITPWKDVKRRDPASPWYGFQYKGERRSGDTSGKKRKKRKKLNFSPAAATRKILIGPGSNLMNSIRLRETSPTRVVIGTDLKYAQVHNEGGYIRIFGKALKKVPKRQFIGESHELMRELENKLMENIDRIVDSVTD